MEGTRSLNRRTDSGAAPTPRSPCVLLSGDSPLSVFILQNKWLQMSIFFSAIGNSHQFTRNYSSIKKKKKKRAGRESLPFTWSQRSHEILMRVCQAVSVPRAG